MIFLRHVLSALFLQPNQAPPTPNSTSPLPQWEEVDLEEQQLRQKLHEMTDNISDHSLSSDEDEPSRPHSSQEIPAWRSPEGEAKPSRLPTRPTSRTSIIISRLEEEQPQQVEISLAEEVKFCVLMQAFLLGLTLNRKFIRNKLHIWIVAQNPKQPGS